ncbi:MAG: hypothetical protein Ta2D_08590 [Rickettsiales bacterium]|nr:MAG: hypothetical protein Ta2D_08590 [Rickettsiales bacterium]
MYYFIKKSTMNNIDIKYLTILKKKVILKIVMNINYYEENI